MDKILHIVDIYLKSGDTSSVLRSFRAKPPIGRIDQILHGSSSFLLHVRKLVGDQTETVAREGLTHVFMVTASEA